MLKNGSINLILYIYKYYILLGIWKTLLEYPLPIPPIPTSPEQMPLPTVVSYTSFFLLHLSRFVLDIQPFYTDSGPF
jgi:hypothetical protein